MRLIYLLLMFVCLSAFGRIDESEQQCTKRYGEPVSVTPDPVGDSKQVVYMTPTYVRILAYFTQGKCYRIHYYSAQTTRTTDMSLPFKPAELIKKMGFTNLKKTGSQRNASNMVQGGLTFTYSHMSLTIIRSATYLKIRKAHTDGIKERRAAALGGL